MAPWEASHLVGVLCEKTLAKEYGVVQEAEVERFEDLVAQAGLHGRENARMAVGRMRVCVDLFEECQLLQINGTFMAIIVLLSTRPQMEAMYC